MAVSFSFSETLQRKKLNNRLLNKASQIDPLFPFLGEIGKADRINGCGVLVVNDGRILTGTRIDGKHRNQICGPGGHIEHGEEPEEAAIREAEEEFGIKCKNLKPLDTLDGGRNYGKSAVFLCTEYDGEPQTDEEEMTDATWRTIEELKEERLFYPFEQSLDLLESQLLSESLEKFNDKHDELGRFAPKNGGSSDGSTKRFPTANKCEVRLWKPQDIDNVREMANSTIESVEGSGVGYESYGLRVQNRDTETVGKEIEHKSTNKDLDMNGYGYEELGVPKDIDGVSTVGIGLKSNDAYSGKVVYLVGGSDGGDGVDIGEKVIKNPVVLAKYGYKDGKLTEIDSITHPRHSNENQKNETKPKASVDPKQAYWDYQDELSAKYGGKPGWQSEMTASEKEKEKQLWNAMLGKSCQLDDSIHKFNQNHDPDTGRFTSGTGGTSGGAWSQTMQAEKQKVMAMDDSDRALYVLDHDGETYENCVEAMESGQTEALVNNYFAIMAANGDPTPTKPLSGHLNNDLKNDVDSGKYAGYEEARKDYIKQMTGQSDSEADATYKELETWFGGGWDRANTEIIDRYIEQDHAYDGKIYRGMHFENDEYSKFMKNVSPGAKISMNGQNSSWSSDEDVARLFSHNADDNVNSVTIICAKNKTSAPVSHLSHQGEDEVLAHSKARWTVLHVETVQRSTGAYKTFITVAESED